MKSLPIRSRNQPGSRRQHEAWGAAVILIALMLTAGSSAAPSAARQLTGTPSHADSAQAAWSAAPMQVHLDERAAPKDGPGELQLAGCQRALSAGQGLLDRLRTTSLSGHDAARHSSAVTRLASALARVRTAVDAQSRSGAQSGVDAAGETLQPACADLLSAEAAARSLSVGGPQPLVGGPRLRLLGWHTH